jgi:predicted  nucleic acid-binding Zn-ribbon protein
MDSEAAKLRARVERFENLRVWATDEKTREALEHFIKEAEDRLRQLEGAMGDHDGF